MRWGVRLHLNEMLEALQCIVHDSHLQPEGTGEEWVMGQYVFCNDPAANGSAGVSSSFLDGEKLRSRVG